MPVADEKDRPAVGIKEGGAVDMRTRFAVPARDCWQFDLVGRGVGELMIETISAIFSMSWQLAGDARSCP